MEKILIDLKSYLKDLKESGLDLREVYNKLMDLELLVSSLNLKSNYLVIDNNIEIIVLNVYKNEKGFVVMEYSVKRTREPYFELMSIVFDVPDKNSALKIINKFIKYLNIYRDRTGPPI